MLHWFSLGIQSLGEENLTLLTGLKKTLKPNRERIFGLFERYKGKTAGLRQVSEEQSA